MKNAQTKSFRYFPVLGIVLILILSSAYMPVGQVVDPSFGSLKTKPYYTKIFTSSELKTLASAQKKYTKAEAKFAKADLNFKKTDGYNKLADDAVRPKDISKAEKKAEKYQKKALKYAFKGYGYVFPANQETFALYGKKLENIEIKDSLTVKKVRKIQAEVAGEFAKGNKLYKEADGFTGLDKYEKLRQADSIQYRAIQLQELAFGLIYNDKDAVYELPSEKKDTTDDNTPVADNDSVNKTDSTKNDGNNTADAYDVKTDSNIYKSKADIILPKLNLTAEEKNVIENSKQKQTQADAVMKQADVKYKEVEALKANLKTETDAGKIENLKTLIQDKETLMYADMIKAANLYLQSTENKYNIYKAHFSEVRPINAPDRAKRGLEYEKNAVKLYDLAKSTTAGANFQPYKSDEYLMLMEALQTSLFAVQEQENAYSTYFGFNTVPLPDNVLAKNETAKDTTSVTDTNPDDKTGTNGKTETTAKSVKYNYLGSYVYSKTQPEPRPLKHKKGIVFKVQVGIFKDLLPLDKYGDESPISYDVFKNNPYQRFMVGEYRSVNQAEAALKRVKAKGFSDAYLVAYQDGRRVSYKRAKKMVQSDNSVPESTDSTRKTSYELPELNYGTGSYDFVKGTNVKSTKGLIYAVQFGMYKMPKTNQEIKFISPLLQEVTDKGVKYLKGPYATKNEAEAAKKDVINKGFTGAFVTAYNNGTHIALNKASKIEKANAGKKAVPNVYFAVQIGAYSSELSDNVKTEFANISKQYKISTHKNVNGLTVYTVGQYTNYKEATIIKNKLRSEGYEDVFLVAFNNGKKISVKKAIELTKK